MAARPTIFLNRIGAKILILLEYVTFRRCLHSLSSFVVLSLAHQVSVKLFISLALIIPILLFETIKSTRALTVFNKHFIRFCILGRPLKSTHRVRNLVKGSRWGGSRAGNIGSACVWYTLCLLSVLCWVDFDYGRRGAFLQEASWLVAVIIVFLPFFAVVRITLRVWCTVPFFRCIATSIIISDLLYADSWS